MSMYELVKGAPLLLTQVDMHVNRGMEVTLVDLMVLMDRWYVPPGAIIPDSDLVYIVRRPRSRLRRWLLRLSQGG